MNDTLQSRVFAYFRQQSELGMPDYILPQKRPIAAPASAENSPPPPLAREESYEVKRAALIDLYREVENCRGCTLGSLRTKMVFGAGKVSAPLMVVGEAPGYEEDRQGRPFVGKAGALLTKMLAAINIDRECDAFITNVLKCRPPENRDPQQAETLACIPILKRQITILNPRAILALGRIAAHGLFNTADSISTLRTGIHAYNGIPVVITYHPAALLRNEQYKRPAWEDLKRLQTVLKEKGVYGSKC